MKNDRPPLSLEECANAYCLLMANAYRLIEDGEKLSAQKRFVGAVGSFHAAAHEIVRAHLISHAVVLEESNEAGWRRFWFDIDDRSRRLEILESDIHPSIYRSETARTRYAESFRLLDDDFRHVAYDDAREIFLPPGGAHLADHADKELARLSYEYIMGLFHAFNFYGLPNPLTQIKTFYALRADHQAGRPS